MISIVILSLIACCSAKLSDIKRVYAFGDSFVDDNASPFSNWKKLSYPPSPPYNFRWSNGPTFAGYIAKSHLKVECDWTNHTSAAGIVCDNYVNFAEGGACSRDYTGSSDVNQDTYCASDNKVSTPFYPDQIDHFEDYNNTKADKNALFIISVGGNDIAGVLQADGGWVDKVGDLLDQGEDIIEAIRKGVKKLYDLGARNFLIVNIPAILSTPRAFSTLSGTKEEVVDEYLESYTEDFTDMIDKLKQEFSGETIFYANLRGCLREMDVGKFDGYKNNGFTEHRKACAVKSPASLCAEPDEYFWWDEVHPTTAAHKYLADEMWYSMQQKDSGGKADGCMDTDCYGDSIFDKCFNVASLLTLNAMWMAVAMMLML